MDLATTPEPAPARVVILGAGPVGLEAALAAADADWPFTVFESSPRAGGNVKRWGHVRLFTPWSMNVSERMARHLRAAGCDLPGDLDYCPTGAELVKQLLEPLACMPPVRDNVVYNARVLSVGRESMLKHEAIGSRDRAARPFRVVVRRKDGPTAVVNANLVLDCTGTYATPNAAGDGGVPASGEEELGDRIVRWMPDLARDREAWAGLAILLIGAGKSAQTAARDLAQWLPLAPGTHLTWAIRRSQPDWGEVPNDPIPGRQALADAAKELASGKVPGLTVLPGATIDAVKVQGGRILVRLHGEREQEVLVDRILSLTGYAPDTSIYRQLQVHECYATAAPMGLSAQLLGDAAGNCLDQPSAGLEVLRNPEPDFFVLGAKSYGRNSQFLMRMGYQQISEVVGAYEPSCAGRAIPVGAMPGI